MGSGRRSMAFGAVLVAAAGTSLHAQEGTPAAEIVVTATREQREAALIPAHVTVLSGETLQASGFRSVADALQSQVGIQVRSVTGNPSAMEVSLRGFGENAQGRVLVLLDGCPMNPPDMASINWLQFPLAAVRSVEIVRGSGNVLYGDRAVAGVINIITRHERSAPYATLGAVAGSYDTLLLRAGSGGSWGDTTAHAGIEYHASDGYRDRSRFEAAGGSAAVSHDWGERVSATLVATWNDLDNQWPGPLTRSQRRQNPRQSVNPDDDSGGEYLTLNAGLHIQPRRDQDASLGMRYARQDLAINMASWSSYADQTLQSLGAMPRYVWPSTLLGRPNLLIAGVDIASERLDVDRFGERARQSRLLTADIRRDTAGAYARNELTVAEGWTLGVGGRVETAEISAECHGGGARLFDQDKRHDATAFEVSLVRTFPNRSKLFARTATVYRYPFMDEQVSYYGFGGDQLYTDIEPERGWSAEAGGEARWGEALTLAATLYHLSLRDEIAYNLATYRNENLDRTRHQGIEAELAWQPRSGSRLTANVTFTDATYTAGPHDGNTIPLVAAHKASAGLQQSLGFGLVLEAEATYVGKAYLGSDPDNAGERLPDYTVVNARLRHALKRPTRIESFVGVDNVFDKTYATVGYYSSWGEDAYYPAPGRFVKAGLSITL